MSKAPRAKLQGLIAPPPSHNHASEQSPDDVPAQLHDADVPDALPEPRRAEITAAAPRSAARLGRARGKSATETELQDYAHRSLYAKPETLDLIRKIAFEERTSAQALYREGLLLMLRERGLYKDKTSDDV